jgi:hypothetical protein
MAGRSTRFVILLSILSAKEKRPPFLAAWVLSFFSFFTLYF